MNRLILCSLSFTVLLLFYSCGTTSGSRNYAIKQILNTNERLKVDANILVDFELGMCATKLYIANNTESDIEIDPVKFFMMDNLKTLIPRLTASDVVDRLDPKHVGSAQEKQSAADKMEKTLIENVQQTIPAGAAIKGNIYWDISSMGFPLFFGLTIDTSRISFTIADTTESR